MVGDFKMDDKIKLLWTNQSPSAAFAEQTINLDLKKYRFVIVVAAKGVGAPTNGDSATTLTEVGRKGRLFLMWNDKMARAFISSSAAIAFEDGYYVNDSNLSFSKNNSYMIPQKIYGIE